MSANIWQGHRVRLRGVEPGDWEVHFEWDQDSEMQRRLGVVHVPRSREGTRRWAEQEATRTGEDDTYQWEIEALASGEHVGGIGTHLCDRRAGTFRHGLAIREEHQRKGYASEAILLVCRYYFDELRYQKVTTTVYSFNEPSIRLHERLGFQLEGRLRRMIYTHGQHYDALFYGMTVEEFRERHATALPEA
ncbi:MAG: Ribosomal-protein-S5p-alanine acetyltransferase [Ktedonobacterales bacterium]|jgi:RimJ/RimL family protein N-acetyltransferase|nr:MAG: Ribosomal-protein-S5p-alanine acetyltransferase [Ktedonobacterales bacterium]